MKLKTNKANILLFSFIFFNSLYAKAIVPTFIPKPLIKNGYIQINTLKTQEPTIFKLLVIYSKCEKKPILKKQIKIKEFNQILNSEKFNKIWLWYVYNKCKNGAKDKACKFILKNKPPKPLRCKNKY